MVRCGDQVKISWRPVKFVLALWCRRKHSDWQASALETFPHSCNFLPPL